MNKWFVVSHWCFSSSWRSPVFSIGLQLDSSLCGCKRSAHETILQMYICHCIFSGLEGFISYELVRGNDLCALSPVCFMYCSSIDMTSKKLTCGNIYLKFLHGRFGQHSMIVGDQVSRSHTLFFQRTFHFSNSNFHEIGLHRYAPV